MNMTRKHFIAIAASLNSSKPRPASTKRGRELQQPAITQWEQDCYAMANTLERTNPQFDRGRFLAACGMDVAVAP